MNVNKARGESTYTGTIRQITREGTSSYGNPTWRVQFESTGVGADYQPHGYAITQLNGSVGYSINNAEYRDVPVTVALTKAGRIFAIEIAS